MTQIEWLELAKKSIVEMIDNFEGGTPHDPTLDFRYWENKLKDAIRHINEAIELGKEASDAKN